VIVAEQAPGSAMSASANTPPVLQPRLLVPIIRGHD
jgi:hypothetical protein